MIIVASSDLTVITISTTTVSINDVVSSDYVGSLRVHIFLSILESAFHDGFIIFFGFLQILFCMSIIYLSSD